MGIQGHSPLHSTRHVLVALAAPRRYRVKLGAEGWPLITGTGPPRAARRDHARRLHGSASPVRPTLDRPRVWRWQVRDEEVRAFMPVDPLPQVAALIGARRKCPLTSEARQRPGLPTVRATSAA